MKRFAGIAAAAFLFISSVSTPSFAAKENNLLSVGDRDEQVEKLQKSLYEQGYLQFPATGFYGTDTQNAVIQFQKDHKLSEDGKAGQATIDAILATAPEVTYETGAMSSVIKIVTTHADNSIYVSDKLVGEVIKPAVENKVLEDPGENKNELNSLYPGDKGDAITKMQQRLKELQYYGYSDITGYYGPVTEDAVKKFQRTNGISEDGLMGDETLKLLYSEQAKPYMMYPGDKGDDIMAMQQRLIDLGYLNDNATGYYGDATENAVKQFQNANNLLVDGKTGQQTRTALYGDEAKALIKSEPEPTGQPEKTEALEEEKPAASVKPEPSSKETAKPEPTPSPKETTKPEPTPSPKETTKPEPTPATKETAKSESTPAPKETVKPEPTPTPKETAKPEPTPASKETAKPEPTPTPEEAAKPQPAPAPEESAKPEPTPEVKPEETGPKEEALPEGAASVDKMLQIARTQMGKPYNLSSYGPDSFDCSGFVYYCLKNTGISVGRLSSAAYAVLASWETVGDINSLKTGDLVFFKSDAADSISHSGIYLGDGTFIHSAPSSNGVTITTMTSGYYQRNFVTAKRIF